MNHTYKLSLKQNFKTSIFTIVFMVFIIYLNNSANHKQSNEFSSYLAFIVLSPSLILHFNYFANDFNKVLIINKNQSLIKLQSGRVINQYEFKDIQSVSKYRTFLFNRFPFVSYYFYKITIKDGFSYEITCLSANDLEKYFMVENRFPIFPII